MIKAKALLKDIKRIAMYYAWENDIGNKKSKRLIDAIYKGKYERRKGVWIQAKDALNALASLFKKNNKWLTQTKNIV